jgi:hypothetical protein
LHGSAGSESKYHIGSCGNKNQLYFTRFLSRDTQSNAEVSIEQSKTSGGAVFTWSQEIEVTDELINDD